MVGPVLPFAMALEFMAEAATALHPGLTVVAIRRMRLFHGVVFDSGAQTVCVTSIPLRTRQQTGAADVQAGLQTVDVAIVSDEAPRRTTIVPRSS